jgi:predicted aspartyl protease
MYRFMTAAGCAALGFLIAQPAMAACSLSTQAIPVVLDGGLRPIVNAKVNGKPARFLVDSGSAVDQISSKFAAAQKLSSAKSAGGAAVVTVPQFEFAGATLKDAPFAASETLSDVDGVIGQTILSRVDVEYDLGSASHPSQSSPASPGAPSASGGRSGSSSPPPPAFGPPMGTVKLAKAEGCEGTDVVYWAKEGDAFFEVPLTPTSNGAPFTETQITVNGVTLRALLASGVPYTMITKAAAEKAGVKVTDPGVKAFSSAKAWTAPFASVKIGDEELKNATLEIGDTSDNFYDVLIGDDFLKAHHLYVANSQKKIYFTYAGVPNAPVFTAHEPKKAAFGMTGHTGNGIQQSGF